MDQTNLRGILNERLILEKHIYVRVGEFFEGAVYQRFDSVSGHNLRFD